MYCMQFAQYGSLYNHKLNNPALTKYQRLLMTSDKMSNLVASYDMHGSFCPARVLYPLIGQPGKTPSPPKYVYQSVSPSRVLNVRHSTSLS